MALVDLNPRLLDEVRRVAKWQRITANELTERALSSYLDFLEWEKLQAEMTAFEAQLPALLESYSEQYVAVHEGRVIDHDADLRALHSRVYAKLDTIPVLLQKVTTSPSPEILMRSPRLES